MHIIQKLKTIGKLEVKAVYKGDSTLNNSPLNKQEGAFDRFNYNIKNDIINKPESYEEKDRQTLIDLKKELANDLGVSIEALNPRNKEGLLAGVSRYKIRISNSGMTLKPMENAEDRIKALILLSNSSQVAFGVEEMNKKPNCLYVITEPEDVVNVQADEFVIRKSLMTAISKLDTKEKTQGVLDIYTLKQGSHSKLPLDTPQRLLDAQLFDITNNTSKSKVLLGILEDKNLDIQLKVVKFINKDLITYKIGSGYVIPNADYTPKNFIDLVNFLSENANSKLLGALIELSIKKPAKN